MPLLAPGQAMDSWRRAVTAARQARRALNVVLLRPDTSHEPKALRKAATDADGFASEMLATWIILVDAEATAQREKFGGWPPTPRP